MVAEGVEKALVLLPRPRLDKADARRLDLGRGRVPGHSRASCEQHQLPPPHSMTSSARARIDGGTLRPSALAVFRLTTSSNVVGCSTGGSMGLAALRILPA